MKTILSHLILTIYISVSFMDKDCCVINREECGKISLTDDSQCYFPLVKNRKAGILSCFLTGKTLNVFE